jgi:hypothetical protein
LAQSRWKNRNDGKWSGRYQYSLTIYYKYIFGTIFSTAHYLRNELRRFKQKVMTMQRLSNNINSPNFEFLLCVLLEMTAGCNRDQLMEIADRLHDRRRRMAISDRPHDDLAVH